MIGGDSLGNVGSRGGVGWADFSADDLACFSKASFVAIRVLDRAERWSGGVEAEPAGMS